MSPGGGEGLEVTGTDKVEHMASRNHPSDPSRLRNLATEILALAEVLRGERDARRTLRCFQEAENEPDSDLDASCGHAEPCVLVLDGKHLLEGDRARVDFRDHLMHGHAVLPLAAIDGPAHRIRSGVSWQGTA